MKTGGTRANLRVYCNNRMAWNGEIERSCVYRASFRRGLPEGVLWTSTFHHGPTFLLLESNHRHLILSRQLL